jgi:aspartate/glutamate racemase
MQSGFISLPHRDHPIQIIPEDIKPPQSIEIDQARSEADIKRWAESVLEEVRNNKSNANHLTFEHTNFPPEYIHYYVQLQEAIAKEIPNEYERPTIDLHIKGNGRPLKGADNNPLSNDKPDLGLLGGMGTLSDAHMVSKLIEKTKKENKLDLVNIQLHSSPPPRPKERQNSILGWLKHVWNYAFSLKSFGSSKCNQYAVLSNTAHSNLDKLKSFFDRPDRVVNMVDHIAKSVSKENPGKVLILGTEEAAQKKVYGSALDKYEVESCLPSRENQSTLQAYIDHVKSGTLDEARGLDFVDLLFNEIKNAAQDSQGGLSHVIFGCTEIPLFLERKVGDRTYRDILNEKIQNDAALSQVPIRFVNTEEAMVSILHEHQQRVVQQKQDSIATIASEPNSQFDNLKAAFTQGVEAYIAIKNDFFQNLFRKSDELMAARQLLEKVNSATDYASLKNILHDFFVDNPTNLQHSSLKTVILESIMGPLKPEEREILHRDICNNNFTELEKGLPNLSSGLMQKANVEPGSVEIPYAQNEVIQPSQSPKHNPNI